MMINPKFTKKEMPHYKDSYDTGVSDDKTGRNWQEYITAFLESDSGYPPNTLIVINSYNRQTDIDEHTAEVEEENVFVNLTPQDAIHFAHDILRLVSALFDINNHTPFAGSNIKPVKESILTKRREEFLKEYKENLTDKD